MTNQPLSTVFAVLLFSFAMLVLGGCSNEAEKIAAAEEAAAKAAAEAAKKVGNFTPTILENGEPSHITVQHILIAFKGTLPGNRVTRSKEEAEELAKKVFEEAKGGASFDALVSEHTDDDVPGIYHMANFFQEEDTRNVNAAMRVMPRDMMVAAFGDVGFPLKPGEIGLAEYDEEKSKYGWHIIRRVK
jgi:hypothetical protein